MHLDGRENTAGCWCGWRRWESERHVIYYPDGKQQMAGELNAIKGRWNQATVSQDIHFYSAEKDITLNWAQEMWLFENRNKPDLQCDYCWLMVAREWIYLSRLTLSPRHLPPLFDKKSHATCNDNIQFLIMDIEWMDKYVFIIYYPRIVIICEYNNNIKFHNRYNGNIIIRLDLMKLLS